MLYHYSISVLKVSISKLKADSVRTYREQQRTKKLLTLCICTLN